MTVHLMEYGLLEQNLEYTTQSGSVSFSTLLGSSAPGVPPITVV